MNYLNNDYDNLYPLHSPYIDSDVQPTIKRQHLEPFQSAPQHLRSMDQLPHPMSMPRVNTYSMERTIYDMNKQISYLFYMTILVIVLLVITVVCCVIMVLTTGVSNKFNK